MNLALAALCCYLAVGSAAVAQMSPSGGIGDPGSARQALPELAPGTVPVPSIVLPPIPPTTPEDRLSQGPRIFLSEVRLDGATILTDDVLRDVVEPFLNREVATEELEEIRRRLTRAYIERGYINSGALLPDQQITDGIVSFNVVEGSLTEIEVSGNVLLNDEYIKRRVRRGAGPPLNITALERQAQLLLQDPAILQMNVELLPGAALGEARLSAKVVEANRFSVLASVANNATPTIGSTRGELYGVVRSLTGWGDVLGLRYGRTKGMNEGTVNWSIPVSADDTLLSFRWDISDAGVISEAFQDLDITSRTETFGIAIGHPLYRTPERQLTIGLALDRRESRTKLLGENFSFTPGVDNGRARVTVLRFLQDWVSRTPDEVIALRSTFNFGLPIIAATEGPNEPDGTFQYWLGQAQYVRQILPELQAVLRADVQLSRQPLFPFEQIAIGGQTTVRGYRENELVRDNAVILSAEARYDVFSTDLSWLELGDRAQQGTLQLAAFYDFGTGWNKASPTPRPREISSVGVGLRWEVGDFMAASLYYGYALRHIRNPDRDPQDSGIHFRVSSRLY